MPILTQALTLVGENRWDEAESLLRQQTERSAEASDLLARLIHNRAVARFAEGEAETAELLLREAQALGLADAERALAELLFHRALRWEREGRLEDAARTILAAVRLSPHVVDWAGRTAVALAGRLHLHVLRLAGEDVILATRLGLAAWALDPATEVYYQNCRSLFVHLGPGDLGPSVGAERFEALVAAEPTDMVALLGLANLERRAGHLTRAEQLCRRALAVWPEAPFAAGRLACLLAELGRLNEASRLFNDLGQAYPGLEQVIRLDGAFFEALRAESPPPSVTVTAAGDSDLVVLAGCDSAYFLRFSDALANSLAKATRLALLHFHIIDPTAEALARAEQIRQRLPGQTIRLTVETLPDWVTDEGRRTYYACARFLRLPDLLRGYGKPLLMLDIDAVILRDVAPLAATLSDEAMDYAIIHGQPQEPWCRLWADVVLMAPTAATIDHFDLVRRYIWHFLQQGRALWFLDQIALYAVTAAGSHGRVPPRVLPWPMDIQNTDSSYCYIWSLHNSQPTNQWADQSPAYRAFQQTEPER